MTAPIFSPAELEQVRAYHLPLYRNLAWHGPLTLLVLLLLLRYGVRPVFAAARRLAQQPASAPVPPSRSRLGRVLDRLWGDGTWATAVWFCVLYALVLFVLNLPSDVYFHYLLPRRFGLSLESPGRFIYDSLKGEALTVLCFVFLGFGTYGLIRRLPRWWLVLGIGAGSLLLFSSALDPYRSRLYFEHETLAPGPLRAAITELMARAQVSFADVVVEKTSSYSPALQAYFAGQGVTRTIVLNDVLVKQGTTAEVLAAVAHEAGHIHEPRWPAWIASALGLLAFLFLMEQVFALARRRHWFGASERADIRTLPLMTVVFFVLVSVLGPLSNAVSRRREAAADRYALRLTQDPAAFQSLMIKAARFSKMDPDPPRWVVLLALNHPTVRERIDGAERVATAGRH